METSKPTSIKATIWILSLKMAFLILIVPLFAMTMNAPIGESSFQTGFRDAIIKRAHLDLSNPAFSLGKLTGAALIPFVLSLLTLLFVLKIKRTSALICVWIEILMTIANKSMPMLPVIVIILLYTSSAKEYFNPLSTPIQQDT